MIDAVAAAVVAGIATMVTSEVVTLSRGKMAHTTDMERLRQRANYRIQAMLEEEFIECPTGCFVVDSELTQNHFEGHLHLRSEVHIFRGDSTANVASDMSMAYDRLSHRRSTGRDGNFFSECFGELSTHVGHRIIERMKADENLQPSVIIRELRLAPPVSLPGGVTATEIINRFDHGAAQTYRIMQEWRENMIRAMQQKYRDAYYVGNPITSRVRDNHEGSSVFFENAIEERKVADKTARKLFRQFAGVEAYDKLHSKAGLLLTGSTGKKYWLLPKAVDSVQNYWRTKQYCVTVPGVPLYDALLATKMLVENDEPKFLKTANVSEVQQRDRRTGGWMTNVIRNADGHFT